MGAIIFVNEVIITCAFGGLMKSKTDLYLPPKDKTQIGVVAAADSANGDIKQGGFENINVQDASSQ